MEKKSSIVVIMVLLLFFPLVCFAQDTVIEAVPEYKKQSTYDRESIKEILAKAKNPAPMQYELVEVFTVNPPGKYKLPMNKATTKTWRKLPYIRSEYIVEGEKNKTMVMIERTDGVYICDSSKNDKYRRHPANNRTIDDSTPIKVLLKEIEASKTLKELGTEVIDGKLSTIIEFDYIDGGFLIRRKVWIWNEKGLPLKMESETKASENFSYTTKGEFKNFNFGDIPDTVFEIPKDKIEESLAVTK